MHITSMADITYLSAHVYSYVHVHMAFRSLYEYYCTGLGCLNETTGLGSSLCNSSRLCERRVGGVLFRWRTFRVDAYE